MGRSTEVQQIRDEYGRGMAIVGQDNVQRIILRECDQPGGANIGVIELIARYARDQRRHVVLEGILHADHYGDMLRRLHGDHQGRSRFYYFDVSFEEILRRHTTKLQAAEYG